MNEFRGAENVADQPMQPAPSTPPSAAPGAGYEFVPTGPHAAIADLPEPIVPVGRVAGGRSHRFRWAIAGGIVLVVALVTAAGAFVLSGAAGNKSLTASAAPKASAMFLELR